MPSALSPQKQRQVAARPASRHYLDQEPKPSSIDKKSRTAKEFEKKQFMDWFFSYFFLILWTQTPRILRFLLLKGEDVSQAHGQDRL